MKRFRLFPAIVTVLLLLGTAAQAKIWTPEAPTNKVTVYPGEASITRVAELDLPSGSHQIAINNLPYSLDVNSIRVGASGVAGARIMGMNHSDERHETAPRETVAKLEEQIRELDRNHRQAVLARIDAFKHQKALLDAIVKQAGCTISEEMERGKMDVAQWDAAVDFMGHRFLAVADSLRLAQNDLQSVDKKLAHLREQLRELGTGKIHRTRTVTVDLELSRAGKIDVELSYVVPGAGWRPVYDARLSPSGDTVVLDYYAEVNQTTGEDWNQVEMSLSTVRPSAGTGPGDLDPWYLRPLELFIRGGRAGEVAYIIDGVDLEAPAVRREKKADVEQDEYADSDVTTVEELLSQVAGSTVLQRAFATVFEAPRRESVSSGDKASRVFIGNYALACDLELICRPALAEAVYRKATIKNDSEAPLLPGSVSILADNDFLGRTFLSSIVTPNQEFELPFGVDNRIEVKREIDFQKASQNSNWLSSDTERQETGIKIVLTNNSGSDVEITVEESLPVSQDERIKVKLDKILPSATIADNEETAVWDLTIPTGDKSTVQFRYRIDHPAGMTIAGL